MPTVDNLLLLDAQRDLELESVDLGIERYRRWRERGDLGAPELQLVGLGITRVAESIQSVKDDIVSGKMNAGPGFLNWAPVVLYFPADMLAGATLTAIFGTIIKDALHPPSRQAVIMDIGAAVETMFHLLKAKELNKELYAILCKTIKHWDGRRARRFYSKVSGSKRAFSAEERANIGGFLFAHALTTRWFDVLKEGRLDTQKVLLDPEVSAELARHHENLELLSPMLYPCVVKPADWGYDGKGGGYIYHESSIFKPINAGDKPPVFRDAPVVIDTINAIQGTRWTINIKVLEVQWALWNEGGDVAGLVRREPIDVEVEVPRIEGVTDEQLIEQKRLRERIHRRNAGDVGSRLEQLWRFRAAERMAKYPAFYHVWQMDWRGRIYPRAACLTPQGSDLDRGLLRFADPVPQTPEGRYWLSVHLANCWALGGVDKDAYAARIAWVERHADRIRSVAADPLGDRWWVPVFEERDGERVQVSGAENPWMFLAACLEYARTDGLTQLPIQQDGTCNGLQHYSALGRDEIGGAAVNLLPTDKPRSIYVEGAAEMNRLLASKTSFTMSRRVKNAAGKMESIKVEIARPWLPKITKKTVKRGFMTYPYGLTPIGMRDQFIEDGHVDGAPDPFVSATVLRDLLMEAIGNIVVKAVEYMSWFKSCAQIANAEGKPLQWRSPTGLVITQDYVVPTDQKLRLPGLGQIRFKSVNDTDRVLYQMRQLNGICPNYIHSFDAAHLMLTVNACHKAGIKDFWLVHDSFGCHAPLVPLLRATLRNKFVDIYEKEDHVQDFKDRNEERLGVPLPDPPRPGGLDLSLVRIAEYPFG